jgi:ribosome biogenesis SPOUT family RNA methylase Rps3
MERKQKKQIFETTKKKTAVYVFLLKSGIIGNSSKTHRTEKKKTETLRSRKKHHLGLHLLFLFCSCISLI